ncbi:MAG: ion transporter [Rhodopirellula sp. JB055]|uniref:ion transporter n=1 Tax=Rhodopirellula sp. JB055 TaxID=3342846 RepID=UPI003709EB16
MSTATEKVLRRRLIQRPAEPGVRQTLYDVIFEADSPLGRGFDIALLVAIIASFVLVSLETVPEFGLQSKPNAADPASPLASWFWTLEWILTILFTIEYALRLYCVRHPLKYAFSFWGIVDLLSILPSYFALFVEYSAKSFVILRSIRLLRVFRVLKLWRMMSQADELSDAVWKSREKIIVFLAVVLVAVTISGTLMYQIETVLMGDTHDSEFTSIPQAMYWAIVTMTTVGYGDVVPHTTIGKIISAALILLGYSLIIVPTGFVSAELSSKLAVTTEHHPCPQCGLASHRAGAVHCDRCGHRLDEEIHAESIAEA